MARRGIPKGQVNWYLREWMEASGLSGRGAQTKMMELTGWSKATMSQLYNGEQDYSPKVVNDAAAALNAEPFELLLPPSRAMALRGMRDNAIKIAAENPAPPVRQVDWQHIGDGTNG
jgi:transcriptional regulator with XRE-family HTH domain